MASRLRRNHFICITFGNFLRRGDLFYNCSMLNGTYKSATQSKFYSSNIAWLKKLFHYSALSLCLFIERFFTTFQPVQIFIGIWCISNRIIDKPLFIVNNNIEWLRYLSKILRFKCCPFVAVR